MSLPIGYFKLHKDVSMNFQLNRWFSWVGEQEMLTEMGTAATVIKDYNDWKREFLALAELSLQKNHFKRSAYYYRCAEFFMKADDPDRSIARQKFLTLMSKIYDQGQFEKYQIPYQLDERSVSLPAYLFETKEHPKNTILFFGGFDSYIEELFPAFLLLQSSGYKVIAFEGPGQGAVLENKVSMTPDWEQPVKAVLDYFELNDVTAIGLSLGGCLVIRAAAKEKRINRVVAFDILTDFYTVNLRQVKPIVRRILTLLIRARQKAIVNALISRVQRKSPVSEWGIQLGMRVTGTSTPYEFIRRLQDFETKTVSHLVTQDALLLAGSEDHFVPTEQFYDQIALLKNARSVTARLFTQFENASNHCQAGNYELAFRTIMMWMDDLNARDKSGEKYDKK